MNPFSTAQRFKPRLDKFSRMKYRFSRAIWIVSGVCCAGGIFARRKACSIIAAVSMTVVATVPEVVMLKAP